MRSEEPDRVVAPVVAQAPLDEDRVEQQHRDESGDAQFLAEGGDDEQQRRDRWKIEALLDQQQIGRAEDHREPRGPEAGREPLQHPEHHRAVLAVLRALGAFINVAIGVHVMMKVAVRQATIDHFYARHFNDAVAETMVKAGGFGIKNNLSHVFPIRVQTLFYRLVSSSMPWLASWSARSFSGWPAWPFTQCQLTVNFWARASSCCHSSAFLTGFLSDVFQPFRFQP